MADEQSKLPVKLIAAAAVILVLAGFAFSRYFGGGEDTTPSSAAYEALMADKTPDGYRAPPVRRGTATPDTGSSRLSATEDTTEPEDAQGDKVVPKKRRSKKKKNKKESQKDKHGIYRFDDGTVDHGKMPPMGG